MLKRPVVVLFVVVVLLAGVRGSPIALDNTWAQLALSLVVVWLLVGWLRGRSAWPRLSTPTTYAGIAFRSRTEAAWAERFDRDGVRWRYEARWFKLRRDGRRMGYLPDFELEDGRFVEIKGAPPTEDEQWKCQQVANITGDDVLIYAGWPGRHSVHRFEPEAARQWIG
jgi:hypothetical protein